MFPRLLSLTLLVVALASAPADAATVVTQPLSADQPVFLTGTPGADTVRLSPDAAGVRIEDSSGVLTGTGTACAQRSATAAVCPATPAPRLILGAGDDHVDSAVAAVLADGGAGTDTLSFARFGGRRLTVSLAAAGMGGIEVLEGSSRGDRLYGTGEAETVRGGAGGDVLEPGGGADVIDGGDGDDLVRAADGSTDRIHCGDDDDATTIDAIDVHLGDCEEWPVPQPMQPERGPEEQEHQEPAPAPPTSSQPRARVNGPARGTRRTIKVLSRPAADAQRTRIGARVLVPDAGAALRMTVRHAGREVGSTEVAPREAGDVVVNVPLDAEIKRVIAQTRHVELTALVELGGIGEEYQATVVEPPPFVLGARGVRRRGGFGEQRLTGTRRGDTLRGDSGDDSLRGLRGNDRLHGGTGNDRLAGSSGNDHLDGYDGDDTLLGGAGDDLIIESRFGDDTLSGGSGNDWIVGGRGTDRISGGSGDDVIFGNSGSDRFDCGPGNDTVFVNLQIERETARNCETILEEDDIPSIRCPEDGTADAETMLGSDGPDVCKGHAGDDDVEGAGGDDQLFGGDGADRLFGRFGVDKLYGEAGDDELEGGRGRDLLVGGAGDDQLNGGYDRDRLFGGTGNDTLIARGGGSDQLDCGPGRDVAIADRTDRVRGCETVRRK